MPEYFTRSFGPSNGLGDDSGLMRVMAGDASELSILVQRQNDAVLFLQHAHSELVLEVGSDMMWFAGGMLIAGVVATFAKLFQVADQSDGLEVRSGFIRFPSVAIEALLLDNSSGRVQLMVWI